jgi:MFS-type transporter involved in bile tolerance (Atg22 family)
MKCVNDIVDGSCSKYNSNLHLSEDTQVWFVCARHWALYLSLPMALNLKLISKADVQCDSLWASLKEIVRYTQVVARRLYESCVTASISIATFCRQ